MNNTSAPAISRSDIVGWVVTAVALGLVIQLHLLSALLAALLVYKLVDILTPWLRVYSLGGDGARVLAVTLIATAVIAALVAIGIGIVAVLRNSGETLPLLMQKMAQIVEETRDKLPAALRAYFPDDAVALQATLAGWLREHAGELQLAGREHRPLARCTSSIGMIIGADALAARGGSRIADRQPLAQAHRASARRAWATRSGAWCSRRCASPRSTRCSRAIYLAGAAAAVRRRAAAREDADRAHFRARACCRCSAT